MIFSNLWQGRTGRLPYLVAFVISSAAVAVLGFLAGKVTIASTESLPLAMAIVRLLVYPLFVLYTLLIGIGLVIVGVPLVFFARRRMRELGLSGVWLLIFPLAPLATLLSAGAARMSMGIWPFPATSPVITLPFWVELAFGALLAALPGGGDDLEHSAKRSLRLVHLATTCEGRLNRQTFALHLVVALGLIIVPDVLGAFGLRYGLTTPGENPVSTLKDLIAPASELLLLCAMMLLTSSTIRRLHDLDQRGWWIILFPFGLTSVVSGYAFVSLAISQQSAVFLSSPFAMLSCVHGLGCLLLLVWLLLKRGSNLNSSQGSSVSRTVTILQPPGIAR